MNTAFNAHRRRLLALLGSGVLASLGAASTDLPAFGPDATDQDLDDAPHDRSLHHRPSLNTRLTRDYGVRFPFVSAGMGFVAYPPLVTAVSNAGGISTLR